MAVLKGNYQDGIEWIYKALEVMPQQMKDEGIDSYLLGYCSDWQMCLGNLDEALEMAKR